MEQQLNQNEAACGPSVLSAGLGTDRCGLEILERVRDQLAATGKADIAAKIEQAINLIDGGLHRIAVLHKSAQIAVSAECDFERGTWTFEIADGVRVGAGRYALIPMPNAERNGSRSESDCRAKLGDLESKHG